MLLLFAALIILSVLFAGVFVATALCLGIAIAATRAIGRWRRRATMELPSGEPTVQLPRTDPPRIGNIRPTPEHPDE
jgi:hypothetical protein